MRIMSSCNLTLGEDAAFQQETVRQTVERVSERFTKEADKKLRKEQEEHKATSESLKSEMARTQKVRSRLYSNCRIAASILAWIISVFISGLLIVGLVASVLVRENNLILAWGLGISVGTVILFTVANLLFGTSVKSLHHVVSDRLSNFLYGLIANRIALGS